MQYVSLDRQSATVVADRVEQTRARVSLLALLTVAVLALAALWGPGLAQAALFSAPTVFPTAGVQPRSVAVGEFNGDSDLDLAVANPLSNNVSVLLGGAGGSFVPASGSPFPVGSPGSSPFSVAVSDFNGDSRADLAIANYGSNDLSVLLGNGGGQFAPAPGGPIAVGINPISIAAGDFNGDSDPDLAVANSNSNDLSVLLGAAGASFVPATGSPLAVGGFPYSVNVADVNGDSDPDLVVTNAQTHNVSVLLGGAGSTFAPAPGGPFPVGIFPTSAAIADFNGDTHLDLAVANYEEDVISILLGNGDGSFTPVTGTSYLTDDCPISIVAADFNGDGDPDLVVANFGTNDLTVLLGGAGASFSYDPSSPVPDGGVHPVQAVVGDFDRDFNPDLAVANEVSADISILLGTGPPTLAIDDVTHPEGNSATTPYTFTVSRSGDTSAPASVQWATADGSASATSDYIQAAGALQFAPGELSKTITLAVRGDTTPEPNETFEVRLSGASGAQIADGEGVGTIENDDLSPSARCTITGTNKNDVISGTPGDDVICAGNGDDRVYGLGGRDVLIGGNGKDTLEGGPGADLLVGGNGKDTLDARDSAPNDVADGGHGSDACRSDVGDFVAGCP